MSIESRLKALESNSGTASAEAIPMTDDDILFEHGMPGFRIVSALGVLAIVRESTENDDPEFLALMTRIEFDLRARDVYFNSKLELAAAIMERVGDTAKDEDPLSHIMPTETFHACSDRLEEIRQKRTSGRF